MKVQTQRIINENDEVKMEITMSLADWRNVKNSINTSNHFFIAAYDRYGSGFSVSESAGSKFERILREALKEYAPGVKTITKEA